jgi:hypothetical protein
MAAAVAIVSYAWPPILTALIVANARIPKIVIPARNIADKTSNLAFIDNCVRLIVVLRFRPRLISDLVQTSSNPAAMV